MEIRIANLKIQYGKISTPEVVVDDLNLAISSGETIGIFGKSGCGKTSILNAIAGLVNYEGTISFLPVTESVLVAYAFQTPSLFPSVTVQKNLLNFTGDRPHPKLLDVILDGIDLDKEADELSGGMQQRVNVARAIISSPNILLLDEPFRSIDEINARDIRYALNSYFRESGTTTILVTHDAMEASYLCDRVLLIGGKSAKDRCVFDTSSVNDVRKAQKLAEQIYCELADLK